MAKVIKETQMVGADLYERPIGVMCSLHEFIEAAEDKGVEFAHGEFFLGTCEYEVFVHGKAVDGDKVNLVLVDTEDCKTDTFVVEASGAELLEEEILEAQNLLKLTKEELVERILDMRS